MKRIFSLLLVLVMLCSAAGCSPKVEKSAIEETLSQFTDALKVYDRDKMTALLTEFPDNAGYVYLDDIFNDDPYIELYRILYGDISYKIVSCSGNKATVAYTMPNIQGLYSTVSTLILNMAMSDSSLQDKLAENDENGIILIQEMMIYCATQNQSIETMTQEFTLTFKEKDGRAIIVCNDELRALITGNYFLSKSTTLAEIEANAVD